MTHTYAVLDVSGPAFAEILAKLAAAGYSHAIHQEDGRDLIDMHGVALAMDRTPRPAVDVEIGSILSRSTKEGRIELRVNAETVQMSLDKAREIHAMLGAAIEAAISDQLLFAFLTAKIGLDEREASTAMLDFRELRQGSRDVVHSH